jgi:hypothetical protein
MINLENKNIYWAVFHAMDMFNPDFLLKFLISKIKLINFRKIPLGGILGKFWDMLRKFLVFGIFSKINILFLLNLKKLSEFFDFHPNLSTI